MKSTPNTFRIIGIIVGVTMLLLVSILCFYGGLLLWAITPQTVPVATVKLDDNQTLKVWYRSSANDDGHGQHYYEITQGNKVIHPTTEIGDLEISRYEDYQVALDHDKTLVCVYDSVRNYGLFVLYNTQNGDLWTSRPAYDNKDWKVYYERLKAENPDLPSKRSFED